MGVDYLVANIIVNTTSNHIYCRAIEIICNVNDISLNIVYIPKVLLNF